MIIFGKIICFVFFLCAFVAVSAQTTSFDVTGYDAQIEPDIANKSVKGKVSVRFIASVNDLQEIRHLLREEMGDAAF